MSTTEAPAMSAQTERHPGRRSGWQPIVRWFGYLCLCTAAGFGGYVAWLLWGTGLETQRAQDRLRSAFEDTIETRPPPAVDEEVVLPGRAYAQIEIPSIGVNFIVVEGTSYGSLKEGPGHYPATADPWDERGRVGIAGHRTTYLHPFLELDKVALGTQILLRTEFGTYNYEVTRNFIIPTAGSGRVLRQAGPPSLVLTTCHPRYSNAERLIVTATLAGSEP